MHTTPLLTIAALVGGLLLGMRLGALTSEGGGETVSATDRTGPAPASRGEVDLAEAEHARPHHAASEGPQDPARPRDTPRREVAGRRESAPTLEGSLAKHLTRMLEEGLLEEFFHEHPEGLEWLVYETYLQTGHLEYALELLQEQPTDGDYGMRIAQELKKRGHPAAADALEATLRAEWWRHDTTELLAELDPDRAVLALREVLAEQEPPGDPNARMRLAEALRAAGSSGEALTLLSGVFDEEITPDETAWQLLRELDPADMERRLILALGETPRETWYREQLASLLLEQGRTSEARTALEALLADGTGTFEARQMLAQLDPARAKRFLESAAGTAQDAGLWSELGECRMDEGDAAGAVDAWLEAFRASPGDYAWGRALEEHAFERYIGEFEAAAHASEDDELWGDLGDTYHRRGRIEDALECYDRANELDPGDGEWTGKQVELKAELGL